MNKQKIIRSFNQVANKYDTAAMLQQQIATKLIQKLPKLYSPPKLIIDLGCGSGYCTKKLLSHYADAEYLLIDIAPNMLNAAKETLNKRSNINYLCADIDSLPLQNNVADIVICSSVLQWCSKIEHSINEIKRICANGIFAFAVFTSNTLIELKQAWQQIDNYQHVNNFITANKLNNMLQAKFSNVTIQTETIAITYKNIYQLLKSLKNMGSCNINKNRIKHLSGKKTLEKLAKNYSLINNDNCVRANFEVTYGYAK